VFIPSRSIRRSLRSKGVDRLGNLKRRFAKRAKTGPAVFTKNQASTRAYAKIRGTGSGIRSLWSLAIFSHYGSLYVFLIFSHKSVLMILAFWAVSSSSTGLFRKNAKPISRFVLPARRQRWQKAGKPIEVFDRRPSLQTPPADWGRKTIIYQFTAFERILIVQRDILVESDGQEQGSHFRTTDAGDCRIGVKSGILASRGGKQLLDEE